MTRSEQFRKSRAWLKTHTFVITKSLWSRIEQLPGETQEEYCYVQNKILISTDEWENPFAFILRNYWKDKFRSRYRRIIDPLIKWHQIEEKRHKWSLDKSGHPKSFSVPSDARASGTCIIDFERKRIRLPKPKNSPTDEVSEYVLGCLKKISVAEKLEFPSPENSTKDPLIRMARIKSHCEHIAGGDFLLNYGSNVKRLFHRIVMMPSEGRCNLICEFPLYEFDVKCCHPVLMLKLFDDPIESKKYSEMLSGDIYRKISEDMAVSDRKQVKEDFQRVVNSGHKRLKWMLKQYPFQFYVYHFPKFAKILYQRTDLANYLQNFEAQLMVKKLGANCRKKNLYWVPMHDGFLSSEDDGKIISKIATDIIFKAIGFNPAITMKPIRKPESNIIL